MKIMEALRFKPLAYYRLDDTTPLQDYSGYARTASITGTETHGIALIADAAYSQRFYTGNTGTFSAPVYTKNKESEPFSLTAVVYPIVMTVPSEQQVVSHGTQYDGITVEGTKVHFTTSYTAGGVARCTYDVEVLQKVDIVGVHTAAKNSLYVNGVLVDEVDITEQQQASTYSHNDESFYAGNTTGTQRILVNGLGFYGRALQTEYVASLYRANSRRAEASVPKMFGGEDVLLGPAVRAAYLDTGWYDETDWSSATMSDVVTDNDQLVAAMENGLTRAGEWIDSVDLYNGEVASPINSVNLWWSGVNATVQASVDGVTWVTVEKGVDLSIIPAGFDPTNKALYVKVSFPAGVTEAYIDSMRVRGYLTNTAVSSNRTLTYTKATPLLSDDDPTNLRSDVGVKINSTGSVVIGVEGSSTPTPIRTIEIWAKPDADFSATFSTTATNTYQNGVGDTSTLIGGQWVVYHRVLSADLTGPLTISMPGQIAKVALYPTALTTTQVAAAYANYFGANTVKYDGSGIISIAEPPASALVYALDWEIVTA